MLCLYLYICICFSFLSFFFISHGASGQGSSGTVLWPASCMWSPLALGSDTQYTPPVCTAFPTLGIGSHLTLAILVFWFLRCFSKLTPCLSSPSQFLGLFGNSCSSVKIQFRFSHLSEAFAAPHLTCPALVSVLGSVKSVVCFFPT